MQLGAVQIQRGTQSGLRPRVVFKSEGVSHLFISVFVSNLCMQDVHLLMLNSFERSNASPLSSAEHILDIITSLTLKSSSSERNVKLGEATIPVKPVTFLLCMLSVASQSPTEPLSQQSFGRRGPILQIFLAFMKSD